MPLAPRNMPYKDSLEEQLISAVSNLELKKVIDLLARGADVNYRTPPEKYVYVDSDHNTVHCDNYESQPYSALRMVVFRISDSALEYTAPHLENPEAEFGKIAKVLLAHGADADDAYRLIVIRHGHGYPHDDWEDNDAEAVLNLIARHRKHQDSPEEKLVTAIYTLNFENVAALLAQGANANHRIPAQECKAESLYGGLAYSPLRIVVCLLSYWYITERSEPEQKNPCVELSKIANALLTHGADAHDAHQLALAFYGQGSTYADIWKNKDATAVLNLIAKSA